MRPFQRNKGNEQSENAGHAGEGEDTATPNNEPSDSARQQESPQRQGEVAKVVPEWNPSVDMFAENEDLLIKATLPGVKQEDVEITLSGGVLTLSGACDSEKSATNYHLREIRRGAFKRSITLPTDSDPSKVRARFENGMLEITIQGGAATTEEISIES